MFIGYGDGLICYRDLRDESFEHPLIGHTNRINHLEGLPDSDKLFSSSNDCTVRQWAADQGACERIFKFNDPIFVSRICLEKGLLYTASWDKQVRAIQLDSGQVDSSFVASREAIKSLLISGKYIFVSGCDPVIRAYDTETGAVKLYEGHTSWVLCLETYATYTEDGRVVSSWLLSGSDDNTIRIWDIESTKCLEELQGHKNGVTCLAFANGELYSGSYDNFIIIWDVPEIEHRIYEKQMMKDEDLRSRKYETYMRFIEAKRGKRKKGKKGKGKGKGKKKGKK